jgi:hypothetical protein
VNENTSAGFKKGHSQRERISTTEVRKGVRIYDGDGICVVCSGCLKVSRHCKVYCAECGTLLENCNGE